MTIELRAGAASLKGPRSSNQDSFLSMPALNLFAVADGVGGYPGGELASRAAVEVVHDWAEAGLLEEPERDLRAAFLIARDRIRARARGPYARMATTLSAAYFDGPVALIAHVGDSRVYARRGGRLIQLTSDHTLASEWKMAAGCDVPMPGAAHHTLTRAIGGTLDHRPDVSAAALEPGDSLLLCSDGVWGPLGEHDLHHCLDLEPQAAADALVQRALARGGSDNATAVVVQRVAGEAR